jgi:hypothetical protein
LLIIILIMATTNTLITSIVGEIIYKEWEKQELSCLGFSLSLRQRLIDELPALVSVKDISVAVLREQIVPLMYSRMDYRHFVEVQKQNGNLTPFARTLKTILQRQLNFRRQESAVTELDKALKGKRSLSYHLTTSRFDEMFAAFCEHPAAFATPADVQRYFLTQLSAMFPLRFDQFLTQLRRNDADSWNDVCDMLNKIATGVTRYGIRSSIYKDIAKDEVLSESYLELFRKVMADEVIFNDANHFRRYAGKVCVNKMYEYCRRNTMVVMMDETDSSILRLAEEDAESAISLSPADYDAENEYEVARFAAVVLLDSRHPLHKTLVEGRQEKINVLIDVSVNGLSYDEIIDERYGEHLEATKRKHINDQMRQDCVRTKKNIMKQIKTILRGQ